MSRVLLGLLVTTSLAVVGFLTWSVLDEGSSDRRERDGVQAERDSGYERVTNESSERPETETVAPGAKDFTFACRVVDEAGKSLSGARVLVVSGQQRFDTSTNRDGRAELSLPEPSYRLEVFAVGFHPYLDWRSDRPTRIAEEGAVREIVLESAASVRGRVLDQAGGAVPGAMVWIIPVDSYLLDSPDATNVVRADERGDFLFHGYGSGTFDVGARAPGFLPGMKLDVAIPERGEVRCDIVLPKGRPVAVTVENGTGATTVYAMNSRIRSDAPQLPGKLTDLANAPVGRAFIQYPVFRMTGPETRFPGMPAGPCDYIAIDRAMITERGVGALYAQKGSKITLRLLDARVVTLRVTDGVDGRALAPEVTRRTGDVWTPISVDGEQMRLPASANADRLRFRLAGYADAAATLQPDAKLVELAMQPVAGAETGTLVLDFGDVLEGRVAVVGRGDGVETWVKHAAGGEQTVEIEGIAIGEYTITVLATGKIPVSVPGVVISRGVPARHRVALSAGGGLKFKIVDEAGKLLGKVALELRNELDERIHINLLTKVSGGRGFVSVDYLPSAVEVSADSGLAAGRYVLRAGAAGYEPGEADFSIGGTEVASVTITLRKR